MLQVHSFTFNPFQENTYIIASPNKECIIIDPGCYGTDEQNELKQFIETEGLKPVRLINTHAHIDHVLGNDFVCRTYNLLPELHKKDLPTLTSIPQYAGVYGINYTEGPMPTSFLTENDVVEIGGEKLEIRFVPGHAPGHIILINHTDKWIIGGDVLFQRSIGRTDLPGGDHQTLLNAIRSQCFTLPDEMTIYCGHGPTTTIGEEKRYNPFLN